MTVVVVGAGLAGLACARVLLDAGHHVVVRERSRVVGGRFASQRLDGRPVDIGAAYFTVSELLTNVSKHAGARTATVDVWRSGDRLMLTVRDDGRGGADPLRGTGLAGLTERVGAVDGVFLVESPAGGPTLIRAEMPCGS